ncbi:hypothetical protein PAN31117_04648 [Pandoraea anapnoica]|uniref:Uncharacterized protein n=1 Tax=Pandoraea anapnoica TaxID=2508301 RepID=A0A5E5AJL2_9BURK|nr:hypothetical protein PAN31117_04648 [Pandoraea anapnoica]
MSRAISIVMLFVFAVVTLAFNWAIVLDAYGGGQPREDLVRGWDSPLAVVIAVDVLVMLIVLSFLWVRGPTLQRRT